MNNFSKTLLVAAGAVLLAFPAFPQGEKDGQGQVIVTILPKHENAAATANPTPQEMKLKINGKDSTVTKLTPMRGAQSNLEVVVLLDDSSRTSLGRQFEDIAHFIQTLPPNSVSAIAYMQNGRATFTAPFSNDHAQVIKALHLPMGGSGISASPYFCLSDLAKNWPSNDRNARREVLMVTDGVDGYNLRYDPDDPYVQSAINDSVKAGLIVYSIYWRNQGRIDNTQYENNAGQNLLVQLTQATGGKSFWEGTGNPVSFQPYLEELTRRFQNQYELSFVVPFNGKPQVETMKLKFSSPGNEVNSPQQVFVGHATAE